MTNPIQTFAAVIQNWDSTSALAADLDEKEITVRAWRNRDSIPSEHWLKIVAAAEKRGYEGISLDILAQLAADRATKAA